jgi:hypothetical protein
VATQFEKKYGNGKAASALACSGCFCPRVDPRALGSGGKQTQSRKEPPWHGLSRPCARGPRPQNFNRLAFPKRHTPPQGVCKRIKATHPFGHPGSRGTFPPARKAAMTNNISETPSVSSPPWEAREDFSRLTIQWLLQRLRKEEVTGYRDSNGSWPGVFLTSRMGACVPEAGGGMAMRRALVGSGAGEARGAGATLQELQDRKCGRPAPPKLQGLARSLLCSILYAYRDNCVLPRGGTEEEQLPLQPSRIFTFSATDWNLPAPLRRRARFSYLRPDFPPGGLCRTGSFAAPSSRAPSVRLGAIGGRRHRWIGIPIAGQISHTNSASTTMSSKLAGIPARKNSPAVNWLLP